MIIAGAVEVDLCSIDDQEYDNTEGNLILTSGGMLLVPAFNTYEVKNIGQKDVDLYLFYGPEEQKSERTEELIELLYE